MFRNRKRWLLKSAALLPFCLIAATADAQQKTPTKKPVPTPTTARRGFEVDLPTIEAPLSWRQPTRRSRPSQAPRASAGRSPVGSSRVVDPAGGHFIRGIRAPTRLAATAGLIGRPSPVVR